MSNPDSSERVVIMRRAVWLITGLVGFYAVFTLWTWRPLELIIAVGIVAVCVVAELGLRHEQRAHLGTSPFGPVQKWNLGR